MLLLFSTSAGGLYVLITVNHLRYLDFRKLMELYAEGNRENAQAHYPHLEINQGILSAEDDFYGYLQDVFFRTKGAVYCIWEENKTYISALRLEPYRDGLLLEALETHPDYRRSGYAVKLISAVSAYLAEKGSYTVYSHVHKRNTASLKTHLATGFQRISDQAVYIDGSVTNNSCTMCLQIQK